MIRPKPVSLSIDRKLDDRDVQVGVKKQAKLLVRLQKLNKKQRQLQTLEAKQPTLHSSLGHRALDYFGWEFAKVGEKDHLKDMMKNQSIADAVDSK